MNSLKKITSTLATAWALVISSVAPLPDAEAYGIGNIVSPAVVAGAMASYPPPAQTFFPNSFFPPVPPPFPQPIPFENRDGGRYPHPFPIPLPAPRPPRPSPSPEPHHSPIPVQPEPSRADLLEQRLQRYEKQESYLNAAATANQLGDTHRAQRNYVLAIGQQVEYGNLGAARNIARVSGISNTSDRADWFYAVGKASHERGQEDTARQFTYLTIAEHVKQGRICDAAREAYEAGLLEDAVDIYERAGYVSDALTLAGDEGLYEKEDELNRQMEQDNSHALTTLLLETTNETMQNALEQALNMQQTALDMARINHTCPLLLPEYQTGTIQVGSTDWYEDLFAQTEQESEENR